MAVANPLGDRKDNYELELSRVRENIKTNFVGLIDCLKARESELLRELDNILASYLSYRSEKNSLCTSYFGLSHFILHLVLLQLIISSYIIFITVIYVYMEFLFSDQTQTYLFLKTCLLFFKFQLF